jgi:hypothetical protein
MPRSMACASYRLRVIRGIRLDGDATHPLRCFWASGRGCSLRAHGVAPDTPTEARHAPPGSAGLFRYSVAAGVARLRGRTVSRAFAQFAREKGLVSETS